MANGTGRKRGPGVLDAHNSDLSDAAVLDLILQRGAKRLVAAASAKEGGDDGALLRLAHDIVKESAHPATAAADSLSHVIEQEKGIFVTVMEYACGRVEDWGRCNLVSKKWHELLRDSESHFLEGPLRLYPVGLHRYNCIGDYDGDTNEDPGKEKAVLIFDGAFVRQSHMPSPTSEDFGDPHFFAPICQTLEREADKCAHRRRDFCVGKFNGFGMVLCFKGEVYRGSFVQGKREGRGTSIGAPLVGFASYEGEWSNNMPHGRGVRRDIFGDSFSGQFSNGVMSRADRPQATRTISS